jgi:pyruvate dehydrogenase E2 component (dihydrolipoamide acetyltransferase)
MSPIMVIGKPGEAWDIKSAVKNDEGVNTAGKSKQKNTINNDHTKQSSHDTHPSSSSDNPDLSSDTKHLSISPRARNLAEKESLPAGGLFGSGPNGRIIERDVLAALESRPPLTLAAKASGGAVPKDGSGFAGRITLGDISSYSSVNKYDSSLNIYHNAFSQEDEIIETPIKGMRKIISQRMHKSLSESAQFTLNASAPVSRLQDFRSRINELDLPSKPLQNFKSESLSHDVNKKIKITVNDLILFAVSRVLARFPYMNAHRTGDMIKTFRRVHIGVAVDTPRGLMVPVIRNCSLLSLSQISAEAKRLAGACQDASIKPDELTGSTFSVSNLGVFGITNFTPVLNTPEVAILGVCGIEMKLTAGNCAGSTAFKAGNCNCGYSFEPHIGFSLTIDHQAVDGAPAARFLKALCEAVADIDMLLAAV